MEKLQRSSIESDLKPFKRTLTQIDSFSETLKSLCDDELKAQLQSLCASISPPMNIPTQVKIFAFVSEISNRRLGMRPFDSQMLAGLALHDGYIVDMKTGEGKTLAAAAPVIVNALAGRKVHVLTFNDYLAKRDSHFLQPLYHFFGLSVDMIQAGMSGKQRKKAHACDIVYATAREVGFDYLRDQLVHYKQQKVLSGLDVAIVDEADSILIDEARIPLVISGDIHQNNDQLTHIATVIKQLDKTNDYAVDEFSTSVHLTDSGSRKIEQQFGCENLFDIDNLPLLTSVNLALHVEVLLVKDIDYIVKDNSIKLVDEFTGRIAEKHRWPDGMQSALESKEGLPVKKEGQTLGSITLQHLMCLFKKVSGMTGTAVLAAQELEQLYQLKTCVIPPRKPCIRIDKPDRVFSTKAEKTIAICNEISLIQRTGQPVLVGTPNVRESENLYALLVEKGIECCLLNAKNDEQEAQIIAQAGAFGAVTICTNLAGRGTDILLGAKDTASNIQVKKAGGLHIIGTSRFESRRIDDQLRGRAARQGEPGSSQYFVSLEDKLFNHLGHDGLLSGKSDTGELLSNARISKKIAHGQRVLEGANLDRRKALYKYSDLVEQQRQMIHQLRNDILLGDGAEQFKSKVTPRWQNLSTVVSDEKLNEALNIVVMHAIDKLWVQHLSEIDYIKEGINLVGTAGSSFMLSGNEPYHVFIQQVQQVFEQLLAELKTVVVDLFNNLAIDENGINPNSELFAMTKSTSSYVVADNPFDAVDRQFIANIWKKLKLA
ncbi:accessory Sec system translocase SecA2 [Shewanella sp. 1_MG-2023]|uniref:accessory Sec system translocase SecA2 n=1 Tax=unclassified Shewanella TaxID=196818 RepID=UPI0026E22F75|nr:MULTISPECIES: accessory Sec system translocase SecA2 [unclassified Shewanella]MDO6610447.1 accessory Sec system translocase SecA2 [Shewanella sp. 7_MG-2023]MDO6770572.1 accessory Sec system translocase SecA2 [Shewanella sp. 2_MG-2023]MDO6794958.1 accessory Sec system translocase SecA2 [Shewanella sp. 1_MG-2023]